MFCRICGERLSDKALFCPKCGTKVRKPIEVNAIQREKTSDFSKKRANGGRRKRYALITVLLVLLIFIVGIVLAVLNRKSNKETDIDINSGDASTEESYDLYFDDGEGDNVDDGYLYGDEGYTDAEYSDAEYDDSEYNDGETSEYVLCDSDIRVIDVSELEILTQEEVKIARNELYARHGRRFQDEELQSYFDDCSWYEGIIEPEDFTDDMLNDIEKQNKDIIVKYEKEMGYR